MGLERSGLIEMSQKEKLKYSNAIPGWAKVFQKVILWFFYLVAFSAIAFGVVLLFWQQWFGALACFAGGGLFAWLSRILRWSNQLYTDLILNCELREEGYYTWVRNVKTGEEVEQFVPFGQMEEVTIARTTRYQSAGANRLGYHIIGAKVIMKWVNERGETGYSLFGLGDPKNVEEWVQRFKENGIPVFSSGANVSIARLEHYQKGYEELPTLPYDQDITSPKVGTWRRRDLKTWRSSEMLEEKRERELQLDKKVYSPILLAMLAGNFLAALAWMPSWEIVDGVFGDHSPSFGMNLINFFLLFIVGAYWRERVKWYRSIRDLGLILLAQLSGWGLASVFGTAPDGVLEAILADLFALSFFNICLFIFWRLLRMVYDRFFTI